MKTHKKTLHRAVLVALLLSTGSLIADTLSNTTPSSRASRDTGNYYLQIDLNPDGLGSAQIEYGGGDLLGNWANFTWDVDTGYNYMTVSKHIRAGSVGYPTAIDSIAGPRMLSYRLKKNSLSTPSGTWFHSGAYLWVDDDNTGYGTHEINIWNHPWGTTDTPSSATYIGSYAADGATYQVYKKWNSLGAGFWSWYVSRGTKKLDMNLDLKALLTWLRNNGLPNHNVINVMPAIEAYASSTGECTGDYSFTSINIPNLTGGVPSPWTSADVGSVGSAGGAQAANGTYWLSGAGTDIGGTADAHQFMYQTLTGDGSLIARLSDQQISGTDKVGLMVRENLAAGSRTVALLLNSGYGTSTGTARFMSRTSTGGTAAWVDGTSQSVPLWFKLVRSGNTFTGSVSSDGQSWTTVGSKNVTMAGSVYMGLAVCSRSTSFLNTAAFDNITAVP